MLKFVAGALVASVVLSCGILACAETVEVQSDIYYSTDNSVKPDLGDSTQYTAVMIKKVKDVNGEDVTATDGSNIVCISQNSESGLNSTISFLLKNTTSNKAEPGYYQAVFGNENGDTSTINFVVNDAGVDANDAMLKSGSAVPYVDNGTKYYMKGFYKDNISLDEFNEYQSIKFVSAGGEYIGALNKSDIFSGELTGGATVAIKLQVNSITDGQQGMNVYFSNDAVTEVSPSNE